MEIVGADHDAGLVVGDIVRIQNVDYNWDGKACGSNLLSTVDYPGGPVAYAKIITVGDNMSVAEVMKGDANYPYSQSQLIHPGARVYMEKMYDAAAEAADNAAK